MAGFARTCALTLIGAGGFLWACGHLPFDEVPGDNAGGTGTGTLEDSGLDVNNGGGDSGRGDADPLDAGRDADAGCAGPTCPGTFVSEAVGKDTNPGTAAAPVQTIKKGLEIASALGGKQNVYVAGGHYLEKVTLVDNIDMLGGYDCSKPTSCTWARNPIQNDTSINNQDYEGVVAPKAVTRKTLIDGFRIVGKPGGPPVQSPGSVGISIIGGTPVVANCRITGGDVTTGPVKRSVGVAILAPTTDPGPLLDRNAIGGGASPDESFGIAFDLKVGATPGSTSVAVVTGNDIRGGTAPFTSGVFATTSGPATLFKSNQISGGSSSAVGGATTSSWGVTITSQGTFERNFINTNPAVVATCTQSVNGNFCGGIQSLGSRAIIINNVIFGTKGSKTAAVLLTNSEGAVAGLAVTVNSNTLDGAGNAGTDGTISTAIALRIDVGTSTTIGKVRNNILLGGLNKNRYGVYEQKATGTAHLAALDNNNFYNPPPARVDFAYHAWDGVTETDLPFAQLSSIEGAVPSGNRNADCGLDGAFHISKTSECVDKGIATEAPATDFEGNNRPTGNGYDIGADETQ